MIFDNVVLTVSNNIPFLLEPPLSAVSIATLSMILSTISSLLSRRSMDVGKYREMMIESRKIQRESMNSMKSGNEKRAKKAQERQQRLMVQQNELNQKKMRNSLFLNLPMMLLWPSLRSLFEGQVIAILPFDFPFLSRELGFSYWYFFCSMASSVIINRLFGMTFEIEPEEIEDNKK